IGELFNVAVPVVFVFGGVSERVCDLDRAAALVAFGFGREFCFFPRFDVPTRADRRDRLRVFVVFPGALVAFRVYFGRAVAFGVVFVFPGVFQWVRDAFQFPMRSVFIFGDLRFTARRGPFDGFGVAVAFAFDRGHLTLGGRARDHLMRCVVFPFGSVPQRVGFARPVTSRIVGVRGRSPFRLAECDQLVFAIVFIGR